MQISGWLKQTAALRLVQIAYLSQRQSGVQFGCNFSHTLAIGFGGIQIAMGNV